MNKIITERHIMGVNLPAV